MFVTPILIMDQSHCPFWAPSPSLCHTPTHWPPTHLSTYSVQLAIKPISSTSTPPGPTQSFAVLSLSPAYHMCSFLGLVLEVPFHYLAPQYAWFQALAPPISTYRYQISPSKSTLVHSPPCSWMATKLSLHCLSWPSRFTSFWTNP